MTTLTPSQFDRIATMSPADAACWAAWYTEQNEKEEQPQFAAEKAILEAIRATVEAEPVEVRRAVGVPARVFNAAVRMLKTMGAVQIDEAGQMWA